MPYRFAARNLGALWVSLASAVSLNACGGRGAEDPDAASSLDADDACPPTEAPWATAPSVVGGAIQETATVAVNGRIYVLGGFDGSLAIVPSVRIYDTATCTWSDGPDLPRAVHHANAAVHDGTIYVLGALESFQFIAIGDVWAWNPETDADWQTRQSMPLGTERGSAVTGVIDGRIYLAGGLRADAVGDVTSYDPEKNTWDTALPALPEPRDHGCGGAIGGKLYVAGGRQRAIESQTATMYEYTPGGAWATLEPMPTARGGTACGVIDNTLIVVGGEGNPDTPSMVFPDVEAYAVGDDAWSTLAPMVTPRHGMGAAAWDGRLYVPGGATVQAFGAVDTHEVLTPP